MAWNMAANLQLSISNMHVLDKNCPLCPRLCAFHVKNRESFPSYHNAPVPSFGELDAELLIVGLAPGLHGANQTGRPFTGDYAGFTLYESLQKYEFAKGNYLATLPDTLDGRLKASGDINGQGAFHLINCRITNAVRCVPPDNKPEPSEIKMCGKFLLSEIKSMHNLKSILSLGLVSHNAVLKALGLKVADYKFAHGAVHVIPAKAGNHSRIDSRLRGSDDIILYNSYHCSRYNINTKRLTQAMFDEVVANISAQLLN